MERERIGDGTHMAQLYLALGSNLGDRLQNLQEALEGLQTIMAVEQVSVVYETVPWGPVQDQPLFLNACLKASTTLSPEELLPAIKELEMSLGREVEEKWGPHTIDIDLLFYDGLITQIGERTIPHRQIRQRPFVLRPLADIAPNLVHPVHQQTVTEMLSDVSTNGLNRYEPGLVLPASPSTVSK